MQAVFEKQKSSQKEHKKLGDKVKHRTDGF